MLLWLCFFYISFLYGFLILCGFDGSGKTRNYVFVVYVTVTNGRTASERKNVEKTAAEEVITDYFIHLKNLETGKFLLTLKVYQILPHHLQGP